MTGSSTSTTTTESTSALSSVVESQIQSLDDTDCYATAWREAVDRAEAVAKSKDEAIRVKWGGRGEGGRGLARRTYQPKDIVVGDNTVRLEYVGTAGTAAQSSPSETTRAASGAGLSRLLLENATIKLLSGHVYALIGRNGCGKSTLLRAMDSCQIPGFPPHIQTLYIPQEVYMFAPPGTATMTDGGERVSLTPVQFLLRNDERYKKKSAVAVRHEIEQLEVQLDSIDLGATEGGDDGEEDVDGDQQQKKIEEISERICQLEEEEEEMLAGGGGTTTAAASGGVLEKQATEALRFMGLDESHWHRPMDSLSAGQRKKAALSTALFCARCDLLLLDEPTNHLDVAGLIQLRRMILHQQQRRRTTVLLVSHDADLINDVATDVVDFCDRRLSYYPGNYARYLEHRRQLDVHQLRSAVALNKKREHMVQTIDNIKKQIAPKRGGHKKKARQIESHRKKLEKRGFCNDGKGHRWTQQNAGTGIQTGSINDVMDASAKRGLTVRQRLDMAQKSLRPPPDKAVQFVFRQPASQWDEPLIVAYDVGHGYNEGATAAPTQTKPPESQPPESRQQEQEQQQAASPLVITKKDGYLFDCVDVCIEEGRRYCILGSNASGKSTLLRILAKLEKPLQGKVKHALNVGVGYMNQRVVERMIETGLENGAMDCISFLNRQHPSKTENEIRGELTSFGLSPGQASSNLRYLSGGERCRLCLASIMLSNPDVLVLDHPTSNLDVESVDALLYGLSDWKGTAVMVSHDANFVRSVPDITCFVLAEREGKLMRLEGGIDDYLKSFGS